MFNMTMPPAATNNI